MSGLRRPWTALAAAGIVAVAVLRASTGWWTAAMPGCVVRRLTGLHCPGCGGTRCAVRLLEGDLAGAVAMNAAVVMLAASFLGLLAAGVWREWRGRPAVGFPPWLAWSLAGFVLTFSVVRNLPWWPFAWFAPD